MIRVDKFRLYPSHAQEKELLRTLDALRYFYNACLQERRAGYAASVRITKASQERAITTIKNDAACTDYAGIHTHLLQDAVARIDRAFDGFFRRVKAGQTPGYPRFKSRERYNTFTFKDAGRGNGAAFVAGNKRLRIHGVGNVKVKVHRPMEGALKTIGVTRDGCGHWYAIATREVATKPLPASDAEVGIDVGILTFAALSDGEMIANPRPLATARIALERAQRVVSRRKRNSKRRRKARRVLAGHHARVCNVRRDFHHQTARSIVRKYGRIAVEELNVKGLAGGMLAKHVNDAAWGQFVTILSEKAAETARTLVRVDPRGTSQKCSECGEVVLKDLGVRVHHCPHCGLALDRDINAARNIAWRAFAAEETRPGRGRRREASDGNL